ncbi:nuclear transport factor 2 family protein [Bradyrhizobium glycinis]|uniref:nuclear transport factor 2 family protein n=1 Tax=Bradyrhizobium glycinis TaxID=2751812 RepID=UPI0018D83FA6|nr:nuclear transport factor 2 family protein [Bradyrhizobium glycinis]MBH5370477.1 nuclear transport factor 2 family protein [Bradyrhizobium glycinis]
MIHKLEDSERRIAQLEDIEAVRQLKCEYARSLDAMINENGPAQAVLNTFYEDATWESLHFGVYRGYVQLSEFLASYKTKISFSLNFMMNQIIEISPDGSSATGRWTTWAPLTVEGKPMLMAGLYKDAYVKRNTRWLTSRAEFTVKFVSDYRIGWAEERISKSWTWPQQSCEDGNVA